MLCHTTPNTGYRVRYRSPKCLCSRLYIAITMLEAAGNNDAYSRHFVYTETVIWSHEENSGAFLEFADSRRVIFPEAKLNA